MWPLETMVFLIMLLRMWRILSRAAFAVSVQGRQAHIRAGRTTVQQANPPPFAQSIVSKDRVVFYLDFQATFTLSSTSPSSSVAKKKQTKMRSSHNFCIWVSPTLKWSGDLLSVETHALLSVIRFRR